MRSIMIACLVVIASGSSSIAADMADKLKALEGEVCNGFAGLKCKEDQWCEFPAGSACGIADFLGKCRPRPEVCTEQYNPVCGCDGKDYSNACKANMNGIGIAHAGKCG